MTTRLRLYNAALRVCGERSIASLSEDREPRRLLDGVWDDEGVESALERGQWKFAMRTVKIDYDVDVTPEFGYRRAFSKPTDWVLTSSVCSDEYFDAPLIEYSHETGYWYAGIDVIYVRYVSNAAAFGGDLSLWPGTFADFVAADFASKIIFKLTSDEDKRDSVLKWRKQKLSLAKNNDAMAGPQQFPAPGNFVTSRTRYNTRRDRGNRNRLLG